MKRKIKLILISLLVVVLSATLAFAVPTTITVRVKTKDAKFLGTSMGGALITIKDADTGELLAKGLSQGSTGNTNLIMKTPIIRGMSISDDTSAKFTAIIDIDEPRYIEVTAYGPLAQRQAANRISVTQWVIPGKHIAEGDAMMLELPGLVVNIQSPLAQSKLEGLPQEVKIEANVAML